jgi:Fatty acid hydroxylase superfamily
VGAPPAAVALYRLLGALNSVVEHANIRVPPRLDRLLVYVWVTPDMHKVHHSREQIETDSNYANLFSFFDRAFGTFTSSTRGPSVHYGIDGYDEADCQSLAAVLWMPFRRDRSRSTGMSLRRRRLRSSSGNLLGSRPLTNNRSKAKNVASSPFFRGASPRLFPNAVTPRQHTSPSSVDSVSNLAMHAKRNFELHQDVCSELACLPSTPLATGLTGSFSSDDALFAIAACCRCCGRAAHRRRAPGHSRADCVGSDRPSSLRC